MVEGGGEKAVVDYSWQEDDMMERTGEGQGRNVKGGGRIRVELNRMGKGEGQGQVMRGCGEWRTWRGNGGRKKEGVVEGRKCI